MQVAALGAAVLIAVECCLAYWFYLYVVWFFALAIFALAAAHPADDEGAGGAEAAKDRGLWAADLSLTTAPAPA